MDVSNNAKIQGTLTVDNSANILDLSVGSITLGTVRRTTWPTGSTTSTSVWSGSDNDISYSLGNVTIHKNLDVSGLDVSNNATIKRNLTVNNKIQATDISVTNIDVSGTINVNKIDIKEHIYFENDISVNGTLDVSGSIFLGNTNTKKPTFTLTSESGQQPFIMLQRGNGNWKLDTDNDNDNKPKHNNSFGLSISDIGLEIFKNNDQDNTVMSDRINNREQCLIIDNSTGNVGIGKRFNTFLDQTGKVYDNGVKLNDDTTDKHGIKYISKATHTLTIIDGSFIIDYSRNPVDPKNKYNTVVKNYHLPDGSGGAANICLNANYVSNTDVSVVDVLMKNKTNGLIWRPEHNHYNKESAKIVFEIEDGSYQGGLGFYTNNSIDKSGSNAQCKERMYIDRKGDVTIHNNLDVSGLDVSNNAKIQGILTVDNSANIVDLSVGSITLGTVRRTAWPTGSTTSTSVWSGSGDDISYSLGDVTIHNNLDVSGLDVSNSATIKDLILKGNTIDISEASGNTGIIDISGKNGIIKINTSDISNTAIYINALRKSQIIFKHDVGENPNIIGQWYANKIQSSWPDNRNNWGEQRLEFITSVRDNPDPRIDDISVSVMGYFDRNGLTIPDGKVLSGDISSNKFKITDSEFRINNSNFKLNLVDGGLIKFTRNITTTYPFTNDIIDAANWILKCDEIKGANNTPLKISESSQNNGIKIMGDSSFNKNVEISGNLVIDGTLTVSGNKLSVDSDKNWYTNTSDDRIKHNEKPIENSLDILNNLQPYRYIKTKEMYTVDHHFQLNEQGEPLDDSGNIIEDYIIEMGIIAQDVEKMDYLKQLVHKPDGEDGIFYLRYNDLFVLNIDATKTLSNKVSNLENKDNDILAKINNIPVEECFIIEFKDNMEMNRDNTNRDDKGRYHSIKINTNKNSNSNWTISNRYFYTPIIKKTYNSENINIIKDIFNSDLYGSVNIDGTKLFPLTNSFIDIILEYNVTIEIESRIIDASKYNNTNNNHQIKS